MGRYLAVVSFDLDNADSSEYKAVYEKLTDFNLFYKIKHINGSIIQLPSTTVAGYFDGVDSSEVLARLEHSIDTLFKSLHLKGKYFIFSGANWAWNGKSVT